MQCRDRGGGHMTPPKISGLESRGDFPFGPQVDLHDRRRSPHEPTLTLGLNGPTGHAHFPLIYADKPNRVPKINFVKNERYIRDLRPKID